MLDSFTGRAKRLDDIDLPIIGQTIGVGEDEIHAILDVESAGTGFDRQGRPRMLFEPHIFYRELARHPKARAEAERRGLAYKDWRRNYPKDSYPRLKAALRLCDEFDLGAEPALRSASWGLGQIMGFNCKLAGYGSAEAMVRDFLDDEEHHLRAMVAFIVTAKLDDELRRHDWEGFAEGYNGKGFRKNGYHAKLAQRFAWWQTKPDTPIPDNLRLENLMCTA
jgi:hypothetical protein